MRKCKKIFFLFLTVFFAFGIFAGCGGLESGEQKEKKDVAMGRYLEEEIPLPKGVALAKHMVQLEDGTIRLAAVDQDGYLTVWDLQKEDVWKKAYDAPREWRASDSFYIVGAALSPKGDCMVYFSEYEDSMTTRDSVRYLNAAGEVSDWVMTPESYVLKLYATRGGNFYLKSGDGISQIDVKNGESRAVVTGEENLFTCIAGETGYVYTQDGFVPYNLATGDPREKDQGLDDAIRESGASLELVSVLNQPIIFWGEDESEELFYGCSKGIYRHTKGGSVSEQVVDGALTSLGSPNMSFVAMEKTKDDIFYVLGEDSEGKLMRYVYSDQVSTVPETEIKVFSLYENKEFMQNIIQYQQQHPDVYIHYEVGMTEDGGMTVSDVLKNLSTQIMAGQGADVFLLDGLPVETYVQQGLLEDLTSLTKGKENLYQNLVTSMKQNGKIYGIPMRFGLPLMEAKEEILEEIDGISSMADAVEALRNEQPELPVLHSYFDGKALAEQFYDACAPAWTKEDGTLKEEALTEFYTQLGRLFDEKNYTESAMWGNGVFLSGLGQADIFLYGGEIQMNFGNLLTNSDYANVCAILRDKEGMGYRPLKGQSENTFLPLYIVGMNSQSKNKEFAEPFLSYLMEEEAQMVSQGSGLPIDRNALHASMNSLTEGPLVASSSNDPNKPIEMMIERPSEEEIGQLETYIEKACIPSITNSVLREAVLARANDCATGKITPQEAAKEVAEQVNLYLAE